MAPITDEQRGQLASAIKVIAGVIIGLLLSFGVTGIGPSDVNVDVAGGTSTTTATTIATTTTTTPTPTTTPSSKDRGIVTQNTYSRVINGDYHAKANERIADAIIKGRLYVEGDNVEVDRTRILGDTDMGNGNAFFGIQACTSNGCRNGLKVTNSDIGKEPNSGKTIDTGVQLGNGSIDHSYIHNTNDGVQATAGFSVTNSIIEHLWAKDSTAHMDGIQTYGCGGGCTRESRIENNLIDSDDNSPIDLLPNGCLFISKNGVSYGRTIIKDNDFLGGGFLLRIEVGQGPYQLSGNTYNVTRADRRWGQYSNTSGLNIPQN